jgi:hypothetical protein
MFPINHHLSAPNLPPLQPVNAPNLPPLQPAQYVFRFSRACTQKSEGEEFAVRIPGGKVGEQFVVHEADSD